MADKISGELHVANDVLADIVGYAALECYGVVGMTAPNAADGIAKLLPASRLRRGITVTPEEEGIKVDLYVVIEYGTNITTVSQNLSDQVKFALNEYACVPITDVIVHVQDIRIR
ncbi:MAG: Asp23/Gls24 family envelope stress response protein [Eggerthellaceae bacterium]|nr:Asp23/Gls24 family envelope stress response protein [Eggerthellaceae bacterium]